MGDSLRGLLVALLAVGLSACGDTCGNDVERSVANPAGTLKAVLFERDCGATTAMSQQVSVLASGAQISNEGGNTFVVETDSGVTLRWLGNKMLEVRYPHGARTFAMAKSVGDVQIRYIAD